MCYYTLTWNMCLFLWNIAFLHFLQLIVFITVPSTFFYLHDISAWEWDYIDSPVTKLPTSKNWITSQRIKWSSSPNMFLIIIMNTSPFKRKLQLLFHADLNITSSVTVPGWNHMTKWNTFKLSCTISATASVIAKHLLDTASTPDVPHNIKKLLKTTFIVAKIEDWLKLF